MNSLPIEIFTDICSFLPCAETYRLRSVCKKWKRQCEYALYSNFRSNQQYIKVGVFANERRALKEIRLVPHHYDAENQVIGFRPENPNELTLIHQDIAHAKMSILFNEWSRRKCKRDQIPDISKMRPVDLALLSFHLDYSYLESRRYPISRSLNEELRYLGDRGMIMVYTNSFQGDNACLCIQSLHVHLSWLMAGFFPDIVPQPINEQRQNALVDHLAAHGITDFYPYSERVLKYILSDTEKYISVEDLQKEKPGRLQQIERELSELGVDTRVLWKYSYIKAMVFKESAFRENTAETVQRSEQDWQKRKVDLLRNMNRV